MADTSNFGQVTGTAVKAGTTIRTQQKQGFTKWVRRIAWISVGMAIVVWGVTFVPQWFESIYSPSTYFPSASPSFGVPQPTDWGVFIAPPKGSEPVALRPPHIGWEVQTGFSSTEDQRRLLVVNEHVGQGTSFVLGEMRVTSTDDRPLSGFVRYVPPLVR